MQQAIATQWHAIVDSWDQSTTDSMFLSIYREESILVLSVKTSMKGQRISNKAYLFQYKSISW